ncbi:hypothetical protein TRIUR3_16834 [Triticum urartu]|uniref:Uncharacterized protein n=1 Tax=Triticum urartu TaxID=4572 RepID=M7ZHF5_TRIUA|nr:hypothetical protein TRIUR3_16834 [Triticum urartu]
MRRRFLLLLLNLKETSVPGSDVYKFPLFKHGNDLFANFNAKCRAIDAASRLLLSSLFLFLGEVSSMLVLTIGIFKDQRRKNMSLEAQDTRHSWKRHLPKGWLSNSKRGACYGHPGSRAITYAGNADAYDKLRVDMTNKHQLGAQMKKAADGRKRRSDEMFMAAYG